MTTRTDEQRACERIGSEIGLRMLAQVLATDDKAERHQLFCAAVVLCSGESHPRDAFAGLAAVVVLVLQGQPEPGKGMAASAALAGHVCAKDSTGQIVLSRWRHSMHSMRFSDLQAAEAWLDRVAGQKGGV